MSDNTTLNPGTGGDIIRAEEKGGAKTQVMLLDIGGLGAESLVDSGNPLPVTVANFPATQPVSAAALPLPAGAATAANQATGNTSLANLDTDLGATSDAAASSDTGSFSLISLVKRGLQNWTTLLGRIPAALGQTTMAASLPVTLASNQSAINVSPDNVADNVVTTGSASATGNVVSVSMAGFAGGSFQITGTFVATVTFEQSNDNTNWSSLVTSDLTNTGGGGQTTASSASFRGFTTPAAFVRARVSAYTSGTVNVALVQKRATPPVSGLVLNVGSNTIGNLLRQVGYTDSSTPLAANATFTGTGRVTTAQAYSRFCATAFADQAGTLFIDLSVDSGTTYRQIASVAVAAGAAQQLTTFVTGAAGAATLYRVRYTNGATLQGAFQLSSSFTAA